MSRAEARRRTREAQRAELLAAEQLENDADEQAPAVAEQRRPIFKMPDIRSDLRALPGMFRTRRLLWLPLLLLLVGLVAILVLPGLAPEAAAIADFYVQFFFAPPALFTFFIAGYLAPRASYLVGFVYGLVAGAIWSVAVLTNSQLVTPGTTEPTPIGDPAVVVLNMLVIGVLYGTLASALAAWYREFLKGMQERGRARRAEAEAKERAKRRDERHEARRVAKSSTR